MTKYEYLNGIKKYSYEQLCDLAEFSDEQISAHAEHEIAICAVEDVLRYGTCEDVANVIAHYTKYSFACEQIELYKGIEEGFSRVQQTVKTNDGIQRAHAVMPQQPAVTH